MNTRTRIAPSPTGQDIHIGNLYTALINFAVAKKAKGEFIIRIEDTDRTRFQEGAEEKILNSLKLFGLNYAEGPDIGGPFAPYRQSERLATYKSYAETLVAKGAAYYCICTKERLDALRTQLQEEKKVPRYDKHCLKLQDDVRSKIANGESFVVRLNVPENEEVKFNDLIRGEIVFSTRDIDDQVLLKSDGYPTYHLGVVVDDHLMEISHVIRAEEWISSTPKHILLYNAFGWDLPFFAHVPILRNPDKSKLSKRKNPVWASWYLEQGYLPEAVLNYLALMGWSYEGGREIFTLDEFADAFDLKDVNTVGPVFDVVKLTWMNGQYIRAMSGKELLKRLSDFYPHIENDFTLDRLTKILPLAQERMEKLSDFDLLTSYFKTAPDVSPRSETEKKVVTDLKEGFAKIEDWSPESILEVMKNVMKENSVRMPVLYYLLTGEEKGLPLPQSLVILGRQEVLKRLENL